MSKGLVWLSSYPKSGNTWFRIFLAHLLALKENRSIHLNEVNAKINDHITTDRTWVNAACGFNTAWLTDDAVDALMPELYGWYHDQQTEITYHKMHRAYSYIAPGKPLIPLDRCLRTLYFVRNPLDIAISMANHFNCGVDETITMLGDKNFALYYYPLRQLLFSWSMHVEGWIDAPSENLLCLRYEDMLLDPAKTFAKAVDFLALDVTQDLIDEAISLSSFEKLKALENTVGFADKPPKLQHFFRKGIVGDWQTTLTKPQIQKIIADHAKVMQRFGYINENHEPIIG